MPASRWMLIAALVCVSGIAIAQSRDEVAAERVLGPRWKQVSRAAGMIFTGSLLREFAQAGFVNIAGGCCGTTPEHIATVAAAIRGLAPRALPEKPKRLRLSGLEAFELARS